MNFVQSACVFQSQWNEIQMHRQTDKKMRICEKYRIRVFSILTKFILHTTSMIVLQQKYYQANRFFAIHFQGRL